MEADILNARGIELAEAGRQEEARRLLARAAARGSAEAAANLGQLMENSGDYLAAVEAYSDAIQLGDVASHVRLGNLLSEVLGRVEEAAAQYQRAAEVGDTDGLINLGVLREQMGRGEEAAPLYEAAIAAGDLKAHWLLGDLLAERGELAEAVQHFRAAVQAGEPRALRDLARALVKLGHPVEAEHFFRRALKERVNDVAIPFGNLLSEQAGRASEAEELYRLAIDTGDRFAHNNLALLLERVGRSREAEREFQAGADAGDVLAVRNYGLFLLAAGEVDEAWHYLQMAADAGDEVAREELEGIGQQ